jgi:hypothetical protein
MSGFNLSQWALNHRSIVAYLMIVAVGAGLASTTDSAAADPTFIIKTMVVRLPGRAQPSRTPSSGHGAARAQAAGDTEARFPAQLHDCRQDDHFRQSVGQCNRQEVADIWYHVRKSIGDIQHTLPVGVVGPGFNDDFGDTPESSTGSRRTGSRTAAA